MLLNRIIINFDDNRSLSFETVRPYIKQLYTYYNGFYCEEPILIIHNITNAGTLVIITPVNMFIETVDSLVNSMDLNEEEKEEEKELINFYSKPLKDI